jgi:hypothetical protein
MAIADEMQGIMSLPEETAAPTPEQTAAVDQMRSQLSPSEINTEMLGAAEEADPATVAEFKAELQGLQLPPEVLDMLNTMVEEILDAPQDYPALREKYMAQGLEDLLPPEFDPAFFGALNMAIDQIRGGASPMAQGPMPSGVNTVEDIFTYNPATAAPASMPPEGFAQGGIASLGRNGDTMLAHITPDEAAMLRRRGGSGSINPATGLPEFFSLKGVFKKLGSAVKKFASSTVGKIVIGAALFYFSAGTATGLLGGFGSAAVAAGQGFIAGAGTNLLAGGNLKDSLKAGAKGALTAGALKGITQGASAFKAIPKAVPAEVRDVVKGVTSGEATAFPANPNTAAGTTRTALPLSPSEGGTGITSVGASPAVPATARGVGSISPDFRFYEAGNGAASQSLAQAPSSATALPATAPIGAGAMPSGGASPPRNFFQKGMDRLSPGRFDAAAEAAGKTAYTDTFNQYGGNRLIPGTDAYTTAITKANEAAAAAVVKNTPGMIRQYAPLVATGLGIMAATGGFDAEQPEVPAGYEDMVKGISPGQKLLTANPEMYGLQFGGVNTTYAYNPAQYAMPYAPYAPPPTAPARMRQGGVASLMGYKEGSPASYPRKTGHIAGPGTGTSDDVPAMLSDGEFVFTAKAVRAMGNGSRRAGAKRMYAMMKNLEGRKNG